MDKDRRNEMRQYAWNYFSLHSDQRIKTFNFFLILFAVLVGGLLAFIKDAKYPPLGGVPGGLLLMILSLIFWKLDCRNRELIHHAEDALRIIEADIPESEAPKEMRLFTEEDQKGETGRQARRPSWNPRTWIVGRYNYSDCFAAMFIITAISGLVIGVGSFFIPAAK
jgi:hypothetical protein